MAIAQVEINGTAVASTSNGNVNGEGQPAKIKPGMLSSVKNLYQGKPDNRGKSTWVDTYPDDLEEAAENAESARHALLIRNKKCYDGRKKLEMDSIVVQSPLLKKALGIVLHDYPGVTTTLDRLTFQAPFKPFVHRWAKLVAALEKEEDPHAKLHLELFHHSLEEELRDDLKARDDYILNKVITFDTCWMIFEPGTNIYAIEDQERCAMRLKTGSYVNTHSGPAFALDCEKVDWDGEKFGLGNSREFIYGFSGTKAITKLTTFPLEYHENVAEIKAELVARGKAFERLAGYHYKHYKGVAIGQGMCGPVKYNVCKLLLPMGHPLMSIRWIAASSSILTHGIDSTPIAKSL